MPPLQVLNPAVAPGQEWWLDAEAARAAAAFPLGSPGGPPCSGALTFTLRPGAPIHLTREQVGTEQVRRSCSSRRLRFSAIWDGRHGTVCTALDMLQIGSACRCASHHPTPFCMFFSQNSTMGCGRVTTASKAWRHPSRAQLVAQHRQQDSDG
jgi:hypothetical protein